MIIANTFFFFFKENIESIIGIKKYIGKNNTESFGKILQDKGLSVTINKTKLPNINKVIIEKIFTI